MGGQGLGLDNLSSLVHGGWGRGQTSLLPFRLFRVGVGEVRQANCPHLVEPAVENYIWKLFPRESCPPQTRLRPLYDSSSAVRHNSGKAI